MFAPLILPLQFTCIAVPFLMFGVFAILMRRMKSQAKSIALTILIGCLLFVPALVVVGICVDAVRYGRFEYANGSQIRDPYVEIPQSATNITLHKSSMGHSVRFSIDEAALREWMDTVTKRRRKFANATPFERDEPLGNSTLAHRYWHQIFGQHGWAAPADVIRYKGWRSGRGAGFDVWYSPELHTAYIDAGYW